MVSLSVHPKESVIVTVYPVLIAGQTIIEGLVKPPGFQRYVPPPLAESVDELPAQIGVVPLTVASGTSTFTQTESLAVPQTSVIVTV